jgi:hypothetical protein
VALSTSPRSHGPGQFPVPDIKIRFQFLLPAVRFAARDSQVMDAIDTVRVDQNQGFEP